MSIIQKLRKSRQLSIKQFSKNIQIDVEEIKKWESDFDSIPDQGLSKLAHFFSTSRQNLFESHQNDLIKLETNELSYLLDSKYENGFWGHIGISLKGIATNWYPITSDEASKISFALSNFRQEKEWIIADTLNNRVLLINPCMAQKIYLLDEAQDEPSNDWNLTIDGNGFSGEFYLALDEYLEGLSFPKGTSIAPEVQNEVEMFTDKYDLGQEELEVFLYYSHIYLDGEKPLVELLDSEKISEIMTEIELNNIPIIFDLSSDCHDLYMPSENICLIDTPKQALIDLQY